VTAVDRPPPVDRAAVPTGSPLARVRGLLPDLSPAERRVAAAVLADPAAVAGQTIRELARACDTSEATVVRFCRATGFGGYPQLRLALAREAGRAVSRGEVGGDIAEDDDLAAIVHTVATTDARAIEDTAAGLDLDVLAAVVDVLVAAPRIEIYGVGASGLVAVDLEQKLRRIGRRATACPEAHAALVSAALLGPGDVAVGISHTGATVDTIDALALASTSGATTVALTNFPRSPLAQLADHVLVTAARETTFRSGATASRIAQLTVVDCVFVAVAQRTYADTLSALERTRAAVANRRREGGRP